MRLHFAGLVVAALCAGVGAASAATDATAFSHSITAHDNTLLTNRFLRREYAAGEHDEERAISSSVFSLEKLTNVFKSKVTLEKLQKWASKQTTADDVFNRLKLNKAGDKLMDSPDFNVWVAYTRLVAKNDPDSAMLAVLKTRYSEKELAAMVGAVKKVTTSTGTNGAAAVENALAQKWLSSHYKPDDVFAILGLDRAGDTLLASPELSTWTSFMKLYNSKNPTEKTSLIELLTKTYRDAGVVRIVEAGKKVKSTALAAKRVEAEQMQLWLKNKKSTDDVFKLLKLDEAGESVLTSPLLATWTKYMKYYNKEFPDKTTTLVNTLRTHYGEAALYKLFDKLKTVPATKAMATKLQGEQLMAWRAEKKEPSDVFVWLALNKAGDDLFSNPLLTTWLKYSDDFYSQSQRKSITTIDPVRDAYGDDVLMKMILTAKKDPSTLKMATRLEAELFKGWKNFNAPDDVFKLLKLNRESDNLFESALWPTFTQYLGDYQKMFPEQKATMISALAKAFNDDEKLAMILIAAKANPKTEKLATKLQADQVQYWLANKEKPDELFGLLALDDALDDIFSNPLFKTWSEYLNAFNAKNPSTKTYMIDLFRTSYGDEALVDMLIAAKQVASTEKIATSMETSLLNKWVLAKKSPDQVSTILTAGTVADDATTKLLETYKAKFRETYG